MTSVEPQLGFGGYACPVEGLGPGRRLVLWVRGCARRCPGCLAPDLWEPGEFRPVGEIAAVVSPLLAGVDGVTISGGEPFDQPEALLALIRLLRRETPVEVMVYSGYTLEELREGSPAMVALLGEIDLLMDGAFAEEAPNTLRWRGSDNQRLLLLSARARRHADVVEAPMPEKRPLQLQPTEGLGYRIIGIPRRGDMVRYRQVLQAGGIEVRPEYE